MSTVSSNPFNLRVTSATWTPSYTVPTTAGQVLPIGTNKPGSTGVIPSGISVYNWHYALFDYYGGGAFNDSYSQAGAWTVAGSGGHGVPACNQGGVAFDFTDATWKYHACASTGVTPRNTDYTFTIFGASGNEISDTGMIIGSSPPCPGPSHQYIHIGNLSPSNGGGLRGSYLRLRGRAIGTSSGAGTDAFKFDWNTNLWSDASTNTMVSGQENRNAHYDPVSNKYIIPPATLSNPQALQVYNVTTQAWSEDGYAGAPATEYGKHTLLDLQRRILVGFSIANQTARAIDLDNTASWTLLTLAFSGGATLQNGSENVWAYYPPDGCYYSNSGTFARAYLNKLTPPTYTTGDKFQGTWTLSQAALTGPYATLGTAGDSATIAVGVRHHNRLFYVPSLQLLCWIPGYPRDITSNHVFLIKPS